MWYIRIRKAVEKGSEHMKRFRMDGTDVFYLVCIILIVIGCVCAGEYTVLGQLALFAAISLAVQVICRLVRRHRKRGQAGQQD